MDYIEETLGEKVTRRPWSVADRLPMYFKGLYNIDQAMIGTQECLILSPRGEPVTITAIKKHLQRLNDEWKGPVALELPRLTRQRKQTFVAEKIAFVVPGKQLYLPFVGALLQEKYDSDKASIPKKLQPSAQMLLFRFIYGKNAPLYISKIPAEFNFSAMTVSRAAVQLIETSLVEVYKDGVQKVLTAKLTPKELFEKAQPYLINPVRKRFYVSKSEIINGYFLAGESALARKTMLGNPNIPVYGTTKAAKFASQTSLLIDSEKQLQVEVWRYNPTLLSGENIADSLSLVLSMAHLHDDRIEITIEEMLEKVWDRYGFGL